MTLALRERVPAFESLESTYTPERLDSEIEWEVSEVWQIAKRDEHGSDTRSYFEDALHFTFVSEDELEIYYVMKPAPGWSRRQTHNVTEFLFHGIVKVWQSEILNMKTRPYLRLIKS